MTDGRVWRCGGSGTCPSMSEKRLARALSGLRIRSRGLDRNPKLKRGIPAITASTSPTIHVPIEGPILNSSFDKAIVHVSRFRFSLFSLARVNPFVVRLPAVTGELNRAVIKYVHRGIAVVLFA